MARQTESAKTSADRNAKRRKTGGELALRYRAIFACVAAAALALILLLSILPYNAVERQVRGNADAVLAERFSSVFNGRAAPVTGERVFPKSGGSAFQFVFLAQGQNWTNKDDYVNELIFIVPVSGLTGPAASLFYYTREGELRFVGNCTGRIMAGLSEGAPPPSMEISASNFRKWQAKIEAVVKGLLPDDAKSAESDATDSFDGEEET